MDFTIKVSTDNMNWTTVVTRTGYPQPGNAVQSFTFPGVSARYIQIEGTSLRPNPTDGNRYRMAFAEVEVYEAIIISVPQTTDNAPAGWVNQDVTVLLTASDKESAVAATYYKLDGGPQQTGTGVQITTEGQHELTYWSVNTAGNKEEPHHAIIMLDKTAPVTHSFASQPDGKNGWYISDPSITLTSSDNLSGVTQTVYSINGGEWMTYTGPFVIIEEGVSTIAYKSMDQAGNTELPQSITVRLDKTSPELQIRLDKTLLWPANHKLVNVRADVQAQDGASGIDSVVLTAITSSESHHASNKEKETGTGAIEGDENRQSDIQDADIGTLDRSFMLRAERTGNGTGRVYTIMYTAIDLAGKIRLVSVTVIVPRDNSDH